MLWDSEQKQLSYNGATTDGLANSLLYKPLLGGFSHGGG